MITVQSPGMNSVLYLAKVAESLTWCTDQDHEGSLEIRRLMLMRWAGSHHKCSVFRVVAIGNTIKLNLLGGRLGWPPWKIWTFLWHLSRISAGHEFPSQTCLQSVCFTVPLFLWSCMCNWAFPTNITGSSGTTGLLVKRRTMINLS